MLPVFQDRATAADHYPLAPTAPPESMTLDPSTVDLLLREAPNQTAFYDDPRLTPAQFRDTNEYGACRSELFTLFHWLKELLSSDGRQGEVAEAIGRQATDWILLTTHMSDAQAQMFGAGKHLLFELCKALQANPTRDVQALACKHLGPAFSSGTDLDPRAVTAIGRALGAVSAVSTADGPLQGDRRQQLAQGALEAWAGSGRFPRHEAAKVAQAFLHHLGLDDSAGAAGKPAFDAAGAGAQVINDAAAVCANAWVDRAVRMSTSRASQHPSPAAPLPKCRDAAVANALQRMGPEKLRQDRQKLAASFDRLIALIPPDMTDPSVRLALAAWRDRHVTPSTDFHQGHAEMLVGGQRVLTALCEELERGEPDRRWDVFFRLEHRLSGGREPARAVALLANLLLRAEHLRTGEDNAYLKERTQRFEAAAIGWKVSARAIDEGMHILGLEEPETVYDGPLPSIDAIKSNASWRVCLAKPGELIEPHPLADVGNVDLAYTLDRLRTLCDELIVRDRAAVDAFSIRWLGRTPSGTQDDMVGNLQAFGVDALGRIIDRLAQRGDRADKQAKLIQMLGEMATTRDPAALLLRYARYEVPHGSVSADADDYRRQAVRTAVEELLLPLLQGQHPADVAKTVGRSCRHVQDRLGIRAAEGDTYEPEVGGLMDTSSATLAWVNKRTSPPLK